MEYKPEIVLERDFVQARNGERVRSVRFLELFLVIFLFFFLIVM